jgi:hypothetical protein
MFKERLPSRMESVPAHIARLIALLGPPPKELLKRGQFSDMVRWMPEERMTAKELIDDPWLNNL